MIHGAEVVQVDGNFDDCLKMVRKVSEEYPVVLVNSLNPNRLEGQKTAAFEIVDALGEAPDYHFLPVGNAGNITAYWMGYTQYREFGKIEKLPKMMGFQAEGAAPIVRNHVVKEPETVATAIRIGNPASWKKAVKARDESNGMIGMVSDKEILEAQKLIASFEVIEKGTPVSGRNMVTEIVRDFLGKNGYPPKVRILKISTIPARKGLGSSSAAIVSALGVAMSFLNKLDLDKLFEMAIKIEGHPDNVAPAIYGGLRVSASVSDRTLSLPVKVPFNEIAVFVPPCGISTEKARKVLPKEISFSQAIFNLQRLAILI